MKKADRFWSTFGKWIATGIAGAIAVMILMLLDPVDTSRFSWVKPFNFVQDIFLLIGISTFLFALVGTAMGAMATIEDSKCGDDSTKAVK